MIYNEGRGGSGTPSQNFGAGWETTLVSWGGFLKNMIVMFFDRFVKVALHIIACKYADEAARTK